MEGCECDFYNRLTCRWCETRFEGDYFDAIAALVSAGMDVGRFGISPRIREAIEWYGSLSDEERESERRSLVKVVNENRPRR